MDCWGIKSLSDAMDTQVERQQHGRVSKEEAAPTDGRGVDCLCHPLGMSFHHRSLQSGGWEQVERRVYVLV